jgi:glycosyltransferase involved in cell wall biosynthesis
VPQVVRPPHRSMRQRVMGLLSSRLPDMAQRLPSPQFQAALATTLAQQNPDIVQVEGIELAQYLFQAAEGRGRSKHPLLVFDDHNAEYVLQQRAFETDIRNPRRWIGAAYSFVQWKRLRRYERRACLVADRIVAVSETDAKALRNLVPEREPVVVPNGVDAAFYAAPTPPLQAPTGPASQDLVFVGKMDFRPNVDGVLWFAREVMPHIRQKAPDVRFWVVGKDPHPRLGWLVHEPAIELTGWVEDVRPYIAAAAVYAVPLRIGGGTRLKVLEAMAMGKAIVSTALGCEGFDLLPNQELVIADAPDDFAAAVLTLLQDSERRARLGRAAQRFASSKYDWQMIVPRLERAYEA